MGVGDAVNEVLRVAKEVSSIADLVCLIRSPSTDILESANIPRNCGAVLVPMGIFTGPRHLRLTAYLTEVAWSEGSAIARKKEVEFMLTYLATRQIREALEVFRPKNGDAVLYVWCLSGSPEVAETVECLPPPESDSRTELQAIERTALFWAEQHR